MDDNEPTDNRLTQSEIRPAPTRRLEKPEKYTIPILVALLGLENSEALRKALGDVNSGFWSRINSDLPANAQISLPPGRYQMAIDLCATMNPPVELTIADFQLSKEKLIERIPRTHPRYEQVRAAAGLPSLLRPKATQES
jgi:hypothetical protein